MTDSTEVFVASHQKARNGYGQNGFQGASSDLPGQNTTSGFLPKVTVEIGDWQTRKVDAKPITPHAGMKPRDSKIDFPKDNSHPASKRAFGGNYQR